MRRRLVTTYSLFFYRFLQFKKCILIYEINNIVYYKNFGPVETIFFFSFINGILNLQNPALLTRFFLLSMLQLNVYRTDL